MATELVAARGDSRLARLFSLVQLGDYVSLLPRPAVRRRPHAGRRHPGVQGQPRRRRRLTPGGRRRRRARPDRRRPGAPRRRRAAVPRRRAREPRARDAPAAARAVRGPLFGLLAARPRGETVGLVVPVVWAGDAGERPAAGRPRRPIADHVGLEGRGPLTGRWPAGVPRDFPSMTGIYQPAAFVRAMGLGYTRPASWRRVSPTPGASRVSRRGRSGRGAGPSSPTPWSPSPSSPRTTA